MYICHKVNRRLFDYLTHNKYSCYNSTNRLIYCSSSETPIEHLYPQIAYIAEVMSALSVSNAKPEKDASTLKTIKKSKRIDYTNLCLNASCKFQQMGHTVREYNSSLKESLNV